MQCLFHGRGNKFPLLCPNGIELAVLEIINHK